MSLGRVKTWVDGEVLTAADLNGEFNNVLNNPVALISPSTGAINFNLQAHTNFRAENVAVPPGPSTAAIGRLVFNTASSVLQLDNGTSILTIGPSTSTSPAPVGIPSVQGVRAQVSAVGVSQNVLRFTLREALLRSTDGSTLVAITSTAPYADIGSSGKSINMGTAGPIAGGRDQASTFAGTTTVHYYVIATGSGSAHAGIVSLNDPSVGPTMPTSAGYGYWAFLGATKVTSATTAFATFLQHGAEIVHVISSAGTGLGQYTAIDVLSSGTSTAGTAGLNIQNGVPASPSVTKARVRASLLVTNSTVANKLVEATIAPMGGSPSVLSTSGAAAAGFVISNYSAQTSGIITVAQDVLELPNVVTSDGPDSWFYQVLTTATATETRGLSVRVLGYRVANGDV